MNDWLGVLLSILFVFVLILVVTLLEKGFKLSQETSRKLVHIGVGHWIFFAFAWIDSRWLATIPLLLFILLNYVSVKKNLFAAMETQERQSYGTVYYPIALLILTILFYEHHKGALGVSIMALAWGDGMAAMIGSRFGKRIYKLYGQVRSLEGSLAMFVFSFLSMMTFLTYYIGIEFLNSLSISLILAIVATLLEAISYRDFDNLIVPLGVAGLYLLLI